MGITQIHAQTCIECIGTTASTYKASSIGTNTRALGDNSFAGGNFSEVFSNNGFAFGYFSTVSGLNGIAFGSNAQVSQADGIAIGSYAKSNAANSYVFGQYLTSNGSNSLTFGIGTSSFAPLVNNKSNSIMFGVTNKPSLTIAKYGNSDRGYIGIGTDAPEEMAHVVGKLLIDRTSETASSLQFRHPDAKGLPPNDSLMSEPSYWDIYSDTYGLKFNTVLKSNGTSSQQLIISRSGSVGIDVATPLAKLHVGQNIIADGNITTLDKFVLAPAPNATSDYWEISRTNTGINYAFKDRVLRDVLFMGTSGFIGIGTTNPSAKLDVNGAFKAQSATINGTLTANAISAQSAIIDGSLTANELNAPIATIGTLNVDILNYQVDDITCNLLTADKAQIKDICAEEVRVQLTACWPDYVFSKDYKLLPLHDVEEYITENQHLPNIPSSAVVESNGVELGAMNALLLQKVEELTLYIIQMEKRLVELENK